MRFGITTRELMQQMIRVVHKFKGVEKWFGYNFRRSHPNSSGDRGGIKGHSLELVCK